MAKANDACFTCVQEGAEARPEHSAAGAFRAGKRAARLPGTRKGGILRVFSSMKRVLPVSGSFLVLGKMAVFARSFAYILSERRCL